MPPDHPPQTRIVRAPSPDASRAARLTTIQRVVRVLGMAAMLLLLARGLTGANIEGKTFVLFGYLLGAINPAWSLYALAFMGGLYLIDAGQIHVGHVLPFIDFLAAGAIFGELRLLGRPRQDVLNLTPGVPDPWASQDAGGPLPVRWGLWPVAITCILILIWSSAVHSALLSVFREQAIHWSNWLDELTDWTLWGPATVPEWGLRSGLNWTLGAGFATVAARQASPIRVARFLKFGAAGLLLCCAIGMIDWLNWVPLRELRTPNPDPLQWGRLQGPAGHPGWFAQWIVLMWPGVALWMIGKGRRAFAVVSAAWIFVALALVLTAARAGWLGAGAGLLIGALYLFREHPATRRWLLVAAGALVLAGIAGVIAGGAVLQRRLVHLFAFSDRANYYVSTLIFLRDNPLGIGLGAHYMMYEDTFTPFFRNWQFDHVTSHSFYLHMLVENGPALPLLVVGCLLMLVLETRRAWPSFGPGLRAIVIASWMSLGGILINGVAQDFLYIRAVEYTYWIMGGFILGLARTQAPERVTPPRGWWGVALLVATGIVASATVASHIRRPIIEDFPRPWGSVGTPESPAFAKWTGARDRFAVDPEVVGIEFSLFRAYTPATVEIIWPDGGRETVHLAAGEARNFQRELPMAARLGRLAPRRWMEFRVSPTATPKVWEKDSSDDDRPLGVYVNEWRVRQFDDKAR